MKELSAAKCPAFRHRPWGPGSAGALEARVIHREFQTFRTWDEGPEDR